MKRKIAKYTNRVALVVKIHTCQCKCWIYHAAIFWNMSYREVTSTMKYVKTFSFQVHPLQPTLMELFTFAAKALQLLGTKLANKEHSQFHFQKLFCFKQHFRRSPNLNTISGRSTAYNVQERPSIKTALMLTLCEKLFEMCRCWTSFHYLEASWFVLQKNYFSVSWCYIIFEVNSPLMIFWKSKWSSRLIFSLRDSGLLRTILQCLQYILDDKKWVWSYVKKYIFWI